MGRAVGVVLNAFDFGRNGVLVALEVHHAVVVLVTAAFVARRDMPVVVTAGFLELWLQQRRVRLTLVQVIPGNLHHATHAW
jgi:xanthine/uracil/vitamin C permease (AzgA family)